MTYKKHLKNLKKKIYKNNKEIQQHLSASLNLLKTIYELRTKDTSS